jgi:hypothetical protein
MAATQLAFTLRTSTNVKTVHLLGSWDNYGGQLPLSKDPSKAGSWKGNFRFQTATLKPGQRYWYYYIMDGYHVSHDPAKPATQEPTTGRQLNILDVPKSGATATSRAPPASVAAPGSNVQCGRGLSPSRIVHPKPSKPYASRAVREADYSASPVDDLAGQLEASSLYAGRYDSASPPSSISSSSISSRSDGSSSPSSLSSLSDRSGSSCRCNRYGITRRGDKVLLDCGGSKCGYSDDSSSGCSSESSDQESSSDIEASSDEEEVQVKAKPALVKTIAPKASAKRAPVSSRRR